jgi:hypothetical protein
MDMSRLSQGQMIVGLAGIVLVVSLFLDWVAGASAFDAFSAMDIITLLIGLMAIAYAALPAMGSAQSLPRESGRMLLLLAVLSLGWALGNDLEDPAAGFGAWLALFASVALAYGAYEAFGAGALSRRVGAGAPPPPPTAPTTPAQAAPPASSPTAPPPPTSPPPPTAPPVPAAPPAPPESQTAPSTAPPSPAPPSPAPPSVPPPAEPPES